MNGLGKRKLKGKSKDKKSASQSPNKNDELKSGTLITEPPVKQKEVKEDPELKAKEDKFSHYQLHQ